jgi:hypothetical protein
VVEQISEDRARRAPAVRLERAGPVERTVVWALAVAVVVAAAGVWATGRGGREHVAPPPATTPTTATSEPAPTAVPLPALGAAPAAPAAPAPTTIPTPEPILEDGRHPAYLTAVDVTGGRVQFNVVQYLTGEAAHEYEEAQEGQPDYYESDYYTIDENPRLRTLPVASQVAVTVLRTPESSLDPHPIAFADLPAYLDELPSAAPGRLGSSVYWLTVRGDTVVAIEEQFAA